MFIGSMSKLFRLMISILLVRTVAGQIRQCEDLQFIDEGVVVVFPAQSVLSVLLTTSDGCGLVLHQPMAGINNGTAGFAPEVVGECGSRQVGPIGIKHNFTYEEFDIPSVDRLNKIRFVQGRWLQILNFKAAKNTVNICVDYCSGDPRPLSIRVVEQKTYSLIDDKRPRRSKRWASQAVGLVCDLFKQVVPYVAPPPVSYVTERVCPLCPDLVCEICESGFELPKLLPLIGLLIDACFFIINLVLFLFLRRNGNGRRRVKYFDREMEKLAPCEEFVYKQQVEKLPPPPPETSVQTTFRAIQQDDPRPEWMHTVRK